MDQFELFICGVDHPNAEDEVESHIGIDLWIAKQVVDAHRRDYCQQSWTSLSDFLCEPGS